MTSDSSQNSTIDSDLVAVSAAPTASAEGPGRQIRLGRERAGFSLEELAQQTKLARQTLDALERDDFALLNEPVYIRGYYRKVAKALALPEAGLLTAYQALVAPKAPPAPTKLLLGSGDSSLTPARRGMSAAARFAMIVAALIVVAVIGARLYNRAALSSAKTSAIPHAPANPSAAAPSASGNPPAPLSSTPAAEATPPATATAAPGAAAVATPDAVRTEQSAAEGPTLSLEFRSASWVRVEDSAGKLLLSGVVPSGARQELNGHPPLSVFLGNAPGVSVSYDGKPIDLKPFLKDNATARFSVP